MIRVTSQRQKVRRDQQSFVIVGAACLQYQHLAVRILAEAMGQHGPGGPASDDDVVGRKREDIDTAFTWHD
nr:hypothetical protein [Actinoplanes polyasparticus]